MSEFDERTQRWIDAGENNRPPIEVDDKAREGAAKAIEEAQAQAAPLDDLFSAAAAEPAPASRIGGANQVRKGALNPGRSMIGGTDGPGRKVTEPKSSAIHTSDNHKWKDRGRDAQLDRALGDGTGKGSGGGQTTMEIADVRESPAAPNLAEKFLVPSFTVLDTRADYWQKRRSAWLRLGMRGETSAEHAYVPSAGSSKREASGVYTGHNNEGGLASGQGVRKRALNTTADEHEKHGQAAAARYANEQGGRRRELIYGDSAPGGDPGFYSKKRAAEAAINEQRRQEGLEPMELTTEEFLRDHYQGRESESEAVRTGTSVFDPLLCEIAYRWWSFEGARILDPFAGGVVRGLVAGALGRAYLGVELRPEQIADNREQASRLFSPSSPVEWGREPTMPRWVEHDATQINSLALSGPVDMVFTCPPYADLEVYSDDPRDLSTMPYEQFRECLASAMAQSAARLRDHRFSVWVVGEARGGAQTAEYGLVADTVKAGQAAGLQLYNSAILVNSVGSAALRAQRILRTRKLTRVHQHVLVFLKGDHKRAAAACGETALDR